ncbi:hypothetical protein B0T26DRAFT_752444 [Lasiosphaeria miniovina]|uniref:Tc toxin complex TcA C-terminal TcB-binding domain-containing protein n=1 Tax=Lasiosphaeria miniovina TaxID=1954250 RepID=A0AA40DW50_9PEZI|nr:uncharacterized protein B0T26DRAFT_752444 [Lasiosphaeria miniovina]KAK0718534.1 hypothetical protein B0T26DRAFT_752444 [Lasiosphaeria miniovina]
MPQIRATKIRLANIFGFATSRYFCLVNNPDLQALRSTVDQRLYNIRNCLDIDGRPMPLALWEPSMDPGQLVAAAASGLSLSSALSDLNASLPNYRFAWLLGRALEATAKLKGLESTFLSVKEKRDGEALQLLRVGHEITMNNMVMELKKSLLEEAERSLAALHASQESSKHRFDFYSRLAGMEANALSSGTNPFRVKAIEVDSPNSGSDVHINSLETQSEVLAAVAQSYTESAASIEIMASILAMLPQITPHTEPMGCGVELVWGPSNLLNAQQAFARLDQMNAGLANFKSSQASRKASYVKQYQERLHQMNLAGLEFEHINTQIAAQETHVQTANQDMANQQKLIDNADEVGEFLESKYTNDELYAWLEGSMRTSMYQTYLLAYDLAKKAEQAFRFERRPTAAQRALDFISFGYFNPARDGLQASGQLYLALKQMDVAYEDSRGHDYEMAKSVSLRQLNPYALVALRETGTCTFDMPELAFDMDFPGHFFRRIKTVSVTVPCVVGPYVGRTSGGAMDPRFRTALVLVNAVAVGSGQNDSGAFELNIRDERYLPFEGAGAVSTRQMTLPPVDFRPFDYSSIADVVSTVEDKSKESGLLALWDVRVEFAAEWTRLASPSAGGGETRTLVLRGLLSRLPAFVAGRDPAKVRVADVTLVTNLNVSGLGDLAVDFKYAAGTEGDFTVFGSGPVKTGSLSLFRISEADEQFRDWALRVRMKGVAVDARSRMWLIVRYRLLKPTA